jgi:preprotein translocase subunit SecA
MSTTQKQTKFKEEKRMKLKKKWLDLHDVWLAKRAVVYKEQNRLAKALQALDAANTDLWSEVNKTTGEGKILSIDGEGSKRELVIYKK